MQQINYLLILCDEDNNNTSATLNMIYVAEWNL